MIGIAGAVPVSKAGVRKLRLLPPWILKKLATRDLLAIKHRAFFVWIERGHSNVRGSSVLNEEAIRY